MKNHTQLHRILHRVLSAALAAALALALLPAFKGAAENSWTVTYYNGAFEYYTEPVDDGAVAAGPEADPTDASGAFIGWYVSGGEKPIDTATMTINSNLNLYAKFSNSYGVVRFRNLNYDILPDFTVTAAKIGEINNIPATENVGLSAGQMLQHWYAEGGDGNVNYFASGNENNEVRGLVTLLPKVTGMFTVSFDVNGGSPVQPISGAEGESAPKPEPPKKAGYIFEFWSLKSGNKGDAGVADYYVDDPALTENILLHAVWSPDNKVGFQLVYASGASWTGAFSNRFNVNVDEEDRAEIGSWLTYGAIKALAEKYVGKTGMEMVGHYYESPGTDPEAEASNTGMPRQNGVLNANGTTTITVYYTTLRYDIVFDMTRDSSGNPVPGGKITYDGRDYTDTYKVENVHTSYYTRGNDLWPYPADMREDGSTAATVPEREGYILTGWKVVSSGGSMDGATMGARINEFPWSFGPTRNASGKTLENQITLVPIWTDETNLVKVTSYTYFGLGYNDLIKFLDEDPTASIARAKSKVTFEDAAKYLDPSESFSGLYRDMLYNDASPPVQDNLENAWFYIPAGGTGSPTVSYSPRGNLQSTQERYPGTYICPAETTLDTAEEVHTYALNISGGGSLTFNSGDGTFPGETQTVFTGMRYLWPILAQLVEPPPEPIPPAGYNFTAWYMSQGFAKNDELTDKTLKINSQQIAYAKYDPILPTVTFLNAESGSEIPDTQVTGTYAKSLDALGKNLPAGYTLDSEIPGLGRFTGWFFRQNGEELHFGTDMPLYNEVYTVYAGYAPIYYTVSFYENASDPGPETRSIRSAVTGGETNTLAQGGGRNRRLPALAAQQGSAAIWTTQQNGEGDVFTATTPVVADMSVYAYYDPLVTINYETGTGGADLTRTGETIPAKTGTPLGAAVTEEPGYEFDGWYDGGAKAGTDLVFTPQKNGGVYEAKTYTAKFKAVITYNADGPGTVTRTEERVSPNATAEGSTATPSQDANFAYWKDNHGITIDSPAKLTPASVPGTYTAVFTTADGVTISYLVVQTSGAWGGSLSRTSDSLLKDTGEATGSTAEPNTGFEFAGWYTAETGGALLTAEAFYKPTKPDGGWVNATYYARFIESGNITINYEVGTGRGAVDPESEQTLPLSGAPSGSAPAAKPGYSFDKWTEDAEGTYQPLPVTAGGKFVPQKELVNGNAVFVARTYYAHFAENTVTISYAVGNVKGGTVSSPEDADIPAETGEGYPQGSTPTSYPGYAFVGWAKAADGSDPADAAWIGTDNKLLPGQESADGADYDIYVARTYYAIFAPDEIAVAYIYEAETPYTGQNADGTTAAKIDSGVYGAALATAPYPAPVLDGYAFGGWYTQPSGGGAQWIFGAEGTVLIAGNGVNTSDKTLTLYAAWSETVPEDEESPPPSPETYTVAYNANGGAGNMPAGTATGGEPFTLAVNSFTRAGYSFTNWATQTNGGGTAYIDKYSFEAYDIAGDLTLYAQWAYIPVIPPDPPAPPDPPDPGTDPEVDPDPGTDPNPDPDPDPGTDPGPDPGEPDPGEGTNPEPAPAPGGRDPAVPPVPNIPERTLVPGGNTNGGGEGDELTFIELDEDGTPLGEWYYDEDEGRWIFDEYPPLGSAEPPRTGDAGVARFAGIAAVSLLGAALALTRRRRVK
jgi:uncharacterized repeat protein (TIGR02543 family)